MFRLYFINMEFHPPFFVWGSLCYSAWEPGWQHLGALAKAVQQTSEGRAPGAGALCPGPAAATGPLPAAQKGHQCTAFSGDFEQVWKPLKHTSTR